MKITERQKNNEQIMLDFKSKCESFTYDQHDKAVSIPRIREMLEYAYDAERSCLDIMNFYGCLTTVIDNLIEGSQLFKDAEESYWKYQRRQQYVVGQIMYFRECMKRCDSYYETHPDMI